MQLGPLPRFLAASLCFLCIGGAKFSISTRYLKGIFVLALWICYYLHMLELCHIVLHALEPGRNVRRAYRLSLGQNLFGEWTIELRYGRIGQLAQHRQVTCGSLEEARRVARSYLRRRMSAPRRIGCPYRIVSVDPGDGDLLSPALAGLAQLGSGPGTAAPA